ncbi:MAG: mannose-1-phosphate guanylyltransferase [Lutibacter sp.]
MNKDFYAIIMAGGVGSRFWPQSTKSNPKQFLDLLGVGKTLLQQTFNRFEKLIPSENIFIATNENYFDLVKKQIPKLQDFQIVLEPAMRNTAPCNLYSALKIHKKNTNAQIVVAPSDHYIDDEENFLENIKNAFQFSKENKALITLGIMTNSPNTGFGYIKFSKESATFKKVIQFTEKPDLKTAEKFIESGNYLWNAGIFIWSSASILNAFKTYLPNMYHLFKQGVSDFNSSKENNFISKNYPKADNISIDYGILEKADNVYVLPTNFGWNDLGTWGSLYEKLPKDELGNVFTGSAAIFRKAQNNMVNTTSNKKVVIQGLHDFIVVENEHMLLICPKADQQDIKEITNQVKDQFGDEFV